MALKLRSQSVLDIMTNIDKSFDDPIEKNASFTIAIWNKEEGGLKLDFFSQESFLLIPISTKRVGFPHPILLSICFMVAIKQFQKLRCVR